jgi:hypothetical protein
VLVKQVHCAVSPALIVQTGLPRPVSPPLILCGTSKKACKRTHTHTHTHTRMHTHAHKVNLIHTFTWLLLLHQGLITAPHASSLATLRELTSLRSLSLSVNPDDPVARLGLHCLPSSLTSLSLQVRMALQYGPWVGCPPSNISMWCQTYLNVVSKQCGGTVCAHLAVSCALLLYYCTDM